VRQARLLTLPADDRGPGLPDPDDTRIDVWRGDLFPGDTVVLAAGNLARTVGPDELKNAAVTLHPQSAAEHLHHLFLAAGGARSDTILLLEADEVAATRIEHKLVPVRPAEPLAGAPDRSPIPLADPIVEAAGAMQDGAGQLRTAAVGRFGRAVDGLFDLLPRRRTRYRQVVPRSTRQDSQRRAALAALAFLGVVLALGLGVWVVGGLLPKGGSIGQVNAGEQAMTIARARLATVFGDGDLVVANPDRALTYLREAWTELTKAADKGVAASAVAPLRSETQEGLDRLYHVVHTASSPLVSLGKISPTAELSDLTIGPDGAAYVIDRTTKSVIRIDLSTSAAKVLVKAGDKGLGDPWAITAGGPDLLILDADGALWRWRPSDAKGSGTLAKLRLSGDTPLGRDVRAIAAYVRNADTGLSFFYAVDPGARQILRYSPVADGSGFVEPVGYLAAPADVSDVRAIVIDGDVFTLDATGVTRYQGGGSSGFKLDTPPDDRDVRPGHQYLELAATGDRGVGRLYLWDGLHNRVLAFSKADGTYLQQYLVEPGDVGYVHLDGMTVVERKDGASPVLVWTAGDEIFASPLEPAPEPGAAPTASSSPTASPKATPHRTARPTAKRTPKP
jgi:hypothetical protein